MRSLIERNGPRRLNPTTITRRLELAKRAKHSVFNTINTPQQLHSTPTNVSSWFDFANNIKFRMDSAKRFLFPDNVPEHSVYLHACMEQPLILKCSNDQANTILAGTSNLQFCAFIAVKFTCNDGNLLLGLMHYDGREDSTKKLRTMANFFADAAGDKKHHVRVDTEQNITGLMITTNMGPLGYMANDVFTKIQSAFNENGINCVSRNLLSTSSVFHKINANSENKRSEPEQKISDQLPDYFTAPSKYEYEEETRLKPAIKENRRDFWEEFNVANNSSAKMNIVEKYSPVFLKENEVATSAKLNRTKTSHLANALSSRQNNAITYME